MYEIWSLGRRPFEDIDDGTEVAINKLASMAL